jgi:hypothetical protein
LCEQCPLQECLDPAGGKNRGLNIPPEDALERRGRPT